MDTKSKNEFAEKAMKVMNEEYLQYQPGTPTILKRGFDKNGNRVFVDCDGEKFNADQMIDWFNIVMHDEDNINDGMITEKMFDLLDEGRAGGFITDATPTTW